MNEPKDERPPEDAGRVDADVRLPVGTRIRFVKSIYGGPTSDNPAIQYAAKDDGGVVTGHGTAEGHWVKWDRWPHAFGAEYGTEFVAAG